MKTVTIKEVAEVAGVSIGTVDRVIHSRGRVAEPTRKKVLKVIEESGYKVNVFASHLATSRMKYRFAVIMPNFEQDSSYWALAGFGIKRAADELARYNVAVEFFCFDRFSGDDFNRVYNNAMDSDCDAYLIAPVISEVAEGVMLETPLLKPYGFFDSNLFDCSPIFFIGQNSFNGGLLGAKMLHMLVGDSGDVAVTRMLPEGSHINDRVAGFKKYFADFPGITVHEFSVDYHNYIDSIEKVCKKIEQTGCHGLFVTNANTHLFARNISGAGRDMKIVGFDLVHDNRQCLDDGLIDFIISQNPEMQGERGLKILYRQVVLKESCEPEYMVPLDIITKENLPVSDNQAD